MLINKGDFAKFLKVIRLKDEAENNEIILNFGENGLRAVGSSASKVVAVRGLLKVDTGNIGEVGIENIKLLQSCVGNLGEEIDLAKKDNKLILKGDKVKISYITQNPAYIKNKLNNDKFSFLLEATSDKEIKLSPEQVKKIVSYFNSIGSDTVVLYSQDGKLKLKTEKNENELVATIDTAVEEEFRISLPRVFIGILSLFDEGVSLKLKKETPACIKVDNDKYKFEVLVARKK
jgi:hypothetical protein